MTTGKLKPPALPERRLPEPELKRLEALAEPLARYWRLRPPFKSELADLAVHASGGPLSLSKPSKALRGRLQGKALFDIGAGGPASFMPMSHFAAFFGVEVYAPVDKYCDYSDAIPSMERFARSRYPDIVFQAFSEDMLVFLAKMEDGSGNVVANAIDEFMLRSETRKASEEYALELTAQLARVVPRGGVAFGVNSPFLKGLLEFGFQEIEERPGSIYLKPG